MTTVPTPLRKPQHPASWENVCSPEQTVSCCLTLHAQTWANVKKDLPGPDSSYPSKFLPDSHGPSSLWAVLPIRGRTDLSFTPSGGDGNKEKNGPNLGSSQGKKKGSNHDAPDSANYITHRPPQLLQHPGQTGRERRSSLPNVTQLERSRGGPEGSPGPPEMHILSPTPHGLQKREPRTWTAPGPSASTVGAGH